MKIVRNYMLMAIVTFGLALAGCNSKSSSGQEEGTDTETGTTLNDDNAKWFYDVDKDDLTGDITALNGYLYSTDERVIDSYGNKARMIIHLRYSTDFTSTPSTSAIIMYKGNNGLGRFSDFQGSGFLAVFDDGEIDRTWSLVKLGRDRTTLGVFDRAKAKDFLNKLKASKTCKIQANLDPIGKTTFTFNTEGLKWEE